MDEDIKKKTEAAESPADMAAIMWAAQCEQLGKRRPDWMPPMTADGIGIAAAIMCIPHIHKLADNIEAKAAMMLAAEAASNVIHPDFNGGIRNGNGDG